LPEASARALARTPPAPVSRVRVLVALAVVGLLIWTLVSVAGLGPSWEVVLVAAVGSAGAVVLARAARRVAVVTLLVVAMTGLGWIELINQVQYGTLALTGAPPLVRWCGTTYHRSGVITVSPSTGVGPAYSKILRTPSGYDVFGEALHGHHSCGTSGPLFVGVGHKLFAAYDP
jgi:hypothetical protein